jgi:hypothetical protein
MKIFRWLVLPAVLLLAALDSDAQTVITYNAEVHEHVEGTSPKALFTALIDLLPTADISHDRSTQMLTIVTTTTIGFEELAIITDENGFELISLQQE